MAKEIEVKFKVTNFNPFINRMKLVGGKLEWRGREETFYYDTLSRKLKEENKVLRFRREPTGRNLLTLKAMVPDKKGPFKITNEYQVTTDHFKETHRILKHLGYTPWFNYTKNRQHWRVGSAHVELDTLGKKKFIEIEGPKKTIRQLATVLDLDWNSTLTDSYLTLAQNK